jgi:hypothetical protein
MPKFAVYYVPEETNELYRLGSSVVGYDIRKCEPVHTLEALRCIPHFTDQWVTKAKPYGFHLTIGDSIDFNVGEIARIEKEIIDLLGCFNPEHDFALHRRRDDFVTFWGPAVVLRYDPNDYLKILHAVIAARVHPLGTSSGYLQRYLEDPKEEAKRPYRVHRILKFFSPTVFDSYSPHFTLLRPHSGESKDELTQLFSDTFGRFDNIVLHSISLLVQSAEEENWRIYREFALTQSEQ